MMLRREELPPCCRNKQGGNLTLPRDQDCHGSSPISGKAQSFTDAAKNKRRRCDKLQAFSIALRAPYLYPTRHGSSRLSPAEQRAGGYGCLRRATSYLRHPLSGRCPSRGSVLGGTTKRGSWPAMSERGMANTSHGQCRKHTRAPAAPGCIQPRTNMHTAATRTRTHTQTGAHENTHGCPPARARAHTHTHTNSLSVCWSVGLSVCLSVCASVCLSLKHH